MKYIFSNILMVFVFLCFLFSIALGSENPPQIIVNDYKCHWDCCSGLKLVTVDKVSIYKEPNLKSNVTHTISKSEVVYCYAGEFHTTPVRFNVKRAFDKYSPGDIIWITGYLEEGIWEAIEKGKFVEVDLGLGPDDIEIGQRCEHSECIGIFEKKLVEILWLKVRTKNGIVGWSKDSEKFKKQ
jgi:hypothetical protein